MPGDWDQTLGRASGIGIMNGAELDIDKTMKWGTIRAQDQRAGRENVEIVMLEKLDCKLSKRATRPYIYGIQV